MNLVEDDVINKGLVVRHDLTVDPAVKFIISERQERLKLVKGQMRRYWFSQHLESSESIMNDCAYFRIPLAPSVLNSHDDLS